MEAGHAALRCGLSGLSDWVQTLCGPVIFLGGDRSSFESILKALSGVAIARVGVGAGRVRAGFLSNPCVWVLNGIGAADVALWIFCSGGWVWAECCRVCSWCASDHRGGS